MGLQFYLIALMYWLMSWQYFCASVAVPKLFRVEKEILNEDQWDDLDSTYSNYKGSMGEGPEKSPIRWQKIG